MWILGLKGLTLLGPKVACSRLQDSSAVELWSFHPKVDSPDCVRRDISRFAQCHKTLYNMVNIPFEILFQLPLVCTCSLGANQLSLGELLSGEPTQYQAKRPVQCSRAVKSGATNKLSQHPYYLRSWQKFYPFSMR